MKNESGDPWMILDYESWMLQGSIQEKERLHESLDDEERVQVLNNALTESAVLHARALCDLFTNDIQLSSVLPDWDWEKPEYAVLNDLLSQLEVKYGRQQDPRSPRGAFEMMLASATTLRRSELDCTAALDTVLPLIRLIVSEIQSMRP